MLKAILNSQELIPKILLIKLLILFILMQSHRKRSLIKGFMDFTTIKNKFQEHHNYEFEVSRKDLIF